MSGRHTHILAIHARYRCGRTGACCTSGWPIAAEPPVRRAVEDAIAQGRLRIATGPWTPGEQLACDARGRCVFFEEGAPASCGIQRTLGHARLPSACRHFPRVALLAPGGVSLTLSHYCPTAARLLVAGGAMDVVRDAPAFPPEADYDGLDARAALPLLRPGVFLDWNAHARWERHAVAVLGDERASPEAALARLAADAEAVRAWTPSRGPLGDHVERAIERTSSASPAPEVPPITFEEASARWRDAAACVPASAPPPPAAPSVELARADAEWVQPRWAQAAPVVRRYLAAKAFASWCAVQGEGLRTAVAFVKTALGVLRVEAARAGAAARRTLDDEALVAALRASDLLLVHLAAPDALARRLSAIERPR